MRIKINARRAFTLIEVLIASAVLALFLIMAWWLLAGWMGSGVSGIWRQTVNRELSTFAALVRSDIGRASYPASVNPEDTIVAQTEEYFIVIKGSHGWSGPDPEEDDWSDMLVASFGPGATGSLDQSEEPVLVINQATPGRARIPGFPDAQVKLKRVTYFLSEGAEVYGRGRVAQGVKNLWVRIEEGETSAVGFTENTPIPLSEVSSRRLVQGVNEILVGVPEEHISGVASDPEVFPNVRIRVFCVETTQGRTRVSSTVASHGQTGVRFE